MKKDIKIDFKQLSADPRILVVIIAIACAALIGLCVYTSKQTKQTEAEVNKQVEVFEENRNAIANLLKLKSRSEQYLAQNEQYEKLITSDGLNQEELTVFFDKFVEGYGCRDTLIEFQESPTQSSISSIMIVIEVEGKMENIMALCDGIVTQDRFYRIDSVTFTQANEEDGTKKATINVVAFSK